jgi:hypothetical protein
MALPTQIDERLEAPGVRATDVAGKFVHGAGLGGRKTARPTTFSLTYFPSAVVSQ